MAVYATVTLFVIAIVTYTLVPLVANNSAGSGLDGLETQARLEPTSTATSIPMSLPVPTPVPEPTAPPVPTPAPMPAPTFETAPVQYQDAQLTLVFESSEMSEVMVAGEREMQFNFTVTNQSLVPTSDVALVFEVSGSGRLVSVRSADGPCAEATCNLESFDGHESLTGHIVVLTRREFKPEVSVHADLSWDIEDSKRRRSYANASAVVTDSNQPGDLIWAASVGGNTMSCGDSVLVGPDRLYSGFGRNIHSVAMSDGEQLWHMDWGHNAVFQPTLADGSIYFYSRENESESGYLVRSIDALESTPNWERFVDWQVRGPLAVYEGSVIFTANDWVVDGRPKYSYLVSLEASTGILNWQYRVEEWINTFPVVSGGNVYFGGDDHLYAIDSGSGVLVHRYEATGGTYHTPSIDNEIAYFLSGYGPIHSMDLAAGQRNWEYVPEGRVSGRPVLADGALYFYEDDDDGDGDLWEDLFLHALNAETGALKWRYEVGAWQMQPTAFNGSVYVPRFDSLVSLDAETGSVNWSADYGTICGPLTASDGVLYGRATTETRHLFFAIRAD